MNFFLFLTASGLLFIEVSYEAIRYRRALSITRAQRSEYVRIIELGACKNNDVHSVKHQGRVVDCQGMRTVLLQDEWEHAYMLWWETSWWCEVWAKATQNIFVFLTIVVSVIVAFFYFASQTFLQNKIINQHQQQQLLHPHYYLPPPSPLPPSPSSIEYEVVQQHPQKKPFIPSTQTKPRKALHFI